MFALSPKADIAEHSRHVRLVPEGKIDGQPEKFAPSLCNNEKPYDRSVWLIGSRPQLSLFAGTK